MPVPRIVQEQAERAEALRKQIFEGQPAPAQPPAPAAAPQPPAPAPAPAVSETPPAPSPAPATAPPASAPVDPKSEDRYKVLQGKYNAEVPRLSAERDAALRQAEEFKRQNELLLKQLAEAPKPQLVKPEEVAEYGEGLVDVVRRAAREELAVRDGEIASLKTQLEELRSGVSTSRQLGFLETLGRDHPDYVEVNQDASFHGWLAQRDPFSGLTRQQLLSDAESKQDGARASAIFTAFKRDRDSWTASSTSALSEQAVPDNAAAPQAPAADPSKGRIWTRKEVSDFYDAVRRRQYSAAEASAIEAEIQRAIIDGRVK